MPQPHFTDKEMYNTIINIMRTGECRINPQIIIDFCERKKEVIDHKADRARERYAEKGPKKDPLREVVYAAMTEEDSTIDEIVARINDPEITNAKVQPRLKYLEGLRLIRKSIRTIPATKTCNTRKLVTYALV